MRRRGWFRLDSSMAHEPLSNDEFATAGRLAGHLIDRWVREGKPIAEAGSADITATELMRITGKGRKDAAFRLIQRLADIGLISVRCRADIASITWLKFAELQSLHSRLGAPSYSYSDSNPLKKDLKEKKEPREEARNGGNGPKPGRDPRTCDYGVDIEAERRNSATGNGNGAGKPTPFTAKELWAEVELRRKERQEATDE